MIVLAYNDFREAKHPFAQTVARLHDVDDLALLLLAGSEAGHGLAQLRVELLVLDLDLRDALLAQRLGELLRDELHAGTQRLDVVALLHCRHGPLHVVTHGKHCQQDVAPARLDQLHLLADRTLAVVVELGLQAQVLVLPFGQHRLEFGRGFAFGTLAFD